MNFINYRNKHITIEPSDWKECNGLRARPSEFLQLHPADIGPGEMGQPERHADIRSATEWASRGY